MDVRHKKIEKGEELRTYRLPASAFLYAVRGNARVRLDNSIHRVERFHVLHGGKGMCLSILAEEVLEYYIILYKSPINRYMFWQRKAAIMEVRPFIRC
ncbi:hypothetical protein [Paenibacillus polymyxa]|uniref:hypothetical protein n=1 Tax=Paenibacillus polymyxa TaxID=1406 RepID=UPI002377E861|nr:hypothetical protein [Paenibacillus polymyxa]WDM23577.1 hypothetical protein J4I02_08800 [Paenibacillus polymyxa]